MYFGKYKQKIEKLNKFEFKPKRPYWLIIGEEVERLLNKGFPLSFVYKDMIEDLGDIMSYATFARYAKKKGSIKEQISDKLSNEENDNSIVGGSLSDFFTS